MLEIKTRNVRWQRRGCDTGLSDTGKKIHLVIFRTEWRYMICVLIWYKCKYACSVNNNKKEIVKVIFNTFVFPPEAAAIFKKPFCKLFFHIFFLIFKTYQVTSSSYD